MHARATREGVRVEFALRPTRWARPARTFANGQETPGHGAHLRGLQRALHGALLSDSTRPWRDVFTHHGVGGASILRGSFDVMIHVCVPRTRYAVATTRELESPEVFEAVAQVAAPVFEAWLQERGEDVDRVLERWSPMR